MFTAAFWKDAGRRAVRTFAQTLVGLLAVHVGGDVTSPEQTVDFLGLPWGQIGLTSLLAGIASLLNSIKNERPAKVRAVPAETTAISRQTGGEGAGS